MTQETNPFTNLTGFQRDLLVTLDHIGSSHGLKIKQHLETLYKQEIPHGRLYPELDILVDDGLVKKEPHNRRTNAYVLTERGERELQLYADYVANE